MQRDLHMFLDNIQLRIENNNYSLGKTVLQLGLVKKWLIGPENDLKKEVKKEKKEKT